MKRILIFLSLILLVTAANAQYVTRKAKDSVSNANTRYLTWTTTPDGLQAISLTFTKVSGYTKGSAVLQYRLDTVPAGQDTWLTTGSTFSFTNNSSGESYIWPLTGVKGVGYRIKVTTIDSTQKLYLYGSYLRRNNY